MDEPPQNPPLVIDKECPLSFAVGMRVLIVEDERKTVGFLKRGLSESGLAVVVSMQGDEALALAKSESFDAIILDIGLPNLSGFGVISALRAVGNNTPILCLTARDRLEDRVKGLELGADDYLVKPFAFSELLARLRSLLRRTSAAPTDQALQIGDLEIDRKRFRATRAGKRLELTTREFLLLVLLAERAGEVVARTVITEQIWDMNFDSDTNVVEVAIRRLRTKVDDPFERKLIRTVRGVGYTLDPN